MSLQELLFAAYAFAETHASAVFALCVLLPLFGGLACVVLQRRGAAALGGLGRFTEALAVVDAFEQGRSAALWRTTLRRWAWKS